MMWIVLALSLWGATSLYGFISRQRKIGADQNYAATISMPYKVISNHWGDTTVDERAAWIRQAIKESGNKWNPPVIVIPFRGTYVSTTGSGIKAYSSLSKSFHEYELDAHGIWLAECEHWQAQKVKEFGAEKANSVFTGQQMGEGKFSWSGSF